MLKKKVGFKFKGKNLKFEVKKCNFFQMGRGLMFKKRENAEALLFEFKKNSNAALTSWFVFFPFAVFWLDSRNRVVDFRVVKPFIFSIKAKKPFAKVVEVPINAKYVRNNSFSTIVRKI